LQNPLPLLDGSAQLVDGLKKHFKIEANNIIFKDTFYDHTTFVNSQEHFEVRLADIFGNILHRYHNKGQCEDIWKFILLIISREETVPLYTKVSFKKERPTD
jgi:hypothetical protein